MKGAVCVSNPWDWTIATDYIENGNWLNKYIYGPVLADALLTMFKNSRYAFETDDRINIKDIYSKRYVNIRFFDDRVTAPLFGCAVVSHQSTIIIAPDSFIPGSKMRGTTISMHRANPCLIRSVSPTCRFTQSMIRWLRLGTCRTLKHENPVMS